MRIVTASVAGGTAVIVLLVAVPAVLVRMASWPSPGVSWTAVLRGWVQEPLSAGFLAGLAYIAAWLLWGLVAAAVTVRVYARAARVLRWLPTVRVPGPLQGLTAAVLGATAVSTAAGAAPAQAGALTGIAVEETHRPGLSGPGATAGGDLAAARAVSFRHDADAERTTYTVRRGDTLSSIAQGCLGDADRWPEIFALNRGARFPDVGGVLRDPDLIYPGWKLHLPTAAAPAGGSRPAAPARPPAQPEAATPEIGAAPGDRVSASAASHAPAGGAATASPTPTGAGPAGDATTPTPGAGDTSRPRRSGDGVWLPGGWVDGGLAVAITTAVVLVWAHRQRRYRTRPPSDRSHTSDPDLAPMPRAIRAIRRGLHAAASASHPARGTNPRRDQRPGDSRPSPVDGSGRAEFVSDPARCIGGGDATDVAGPVAPALDHRLAWPLAGLGLTGPGADAAARGFLAAALAAGGEEHPGARTRVIVPVTTAAALLGAAASSLPRTPRLTVTADLSEALDILEEQTMHRTRLVYQHEVDTVADLRAAGIDDEALAPLMLLADAAGRHERARVAALLTQGHRLDIHGVLLGAWPHGDIAVVGDDGTVRRTDSNAHHGFHPADIGRLAVLNPTDTIDILVTLAESHTGEHPEPTPTGAAPPSPPPASPAHTAAASAADGIADPAPLKHPDGSADTAASPHTDTGSTTASPHRPGCEANARPTSIDRPSADAGNLPGRPSPDPRQGPVATATAGAVSSRDRVEVTVLGRPAIIGTNPPRPLRAKSMELLVYLAVCGGDAPAEAILDDLLPDAPASKATHRLHTYISDLRAMLRHHAGPGTYITRLHHRYQLNPDRFDIDLWRLRAAIRATTGTRAERLHALRHAVDTYRPLAEGCDYEWLEPHRHGVQREALDAVTALLEELTDQPDQQATVCATALPHHPYNEQLYQQAIRAHAQLGDLDAIRALRRTLTQRLAEIDTEPSDDTLALADRLIAEVRSRRDPRRVADRPAR
ncbi:LysM peptidoglycan-binding domain-containing protein [Micromonospora globbae]|uniref:LysM peptidoglycan-binding domain-containing protein n=1 Tax=Micromonospora globbae TaxID=1894969 RepID=A0A420EQB9_9ACTN|nr:LysM peptidoglycan-binding domain-containing protein [Micromonospora globbae]RKF22864.1 LysM peptidoglycan-binding domain-containing protein [Micromonospora globbae]